jgi:hypothetical protein
MKKQLKQLATSMMIWAIFYGTVSAQSTGNTTTKSKSLTGGKAFKEFAGKSGYSTQVASDPIVFAGTIVNYILGLLGVIFAIYIIYAGIIWMTAGGEVSRVDRAKNILRNGVIGIIIALGAYAISNFVVNAIIQSTV